MTVLDSLKLDLTAILSKMPKVNMKASEASMVAASLVGMISFLQLFTDRDPVGRCYTFWRQLRNHVSVFIVVSILS
jgi:hypothetical protein